MLYCYNINVKIKILGKHTKVLSLETCINNRYSQYLQWLTQDNKQHNESKLHLVCSLTSQFTLPSYSNNSTSFEHNVRTMHNNIYGWHWYNNNKFLGVVLKLCCKNILEILCSHFLYLLTNENNHTAQQ